MMHTNGPEPGAREKVIATGILQELRLDGIAARLESLGWHIAIHPIDRRHTTEPKTICIDFDKTIANTDYPTIHGVNPGAKEALQAFRDMGYYIIVSSCRASYYHWGVYYQDKPYQLPGNRDVFKDMKKCLDDNGIPYDEIDDGSNGKVSARHYIDDKGVRYENNWPELVEKVREIDAKQGK